MLSAEDLETLISAKKREIQKEKIVLGLEKPSEDLNDQKDESKPFSKQSVRFKETSDRSIIDHYAEIEKDKTKHRQELCELEERLPAGLERYIRRYIGLPVMLKAGEYSPNNPLVRSEHVAGDALLGLGEYERRRNTLRKIRQAQYREYLDQQAKKKQEAKEQAARERKKREEKEKEREERERQLLLEREAYSPERRRASLSCIPVGGNVGTTKVDTAVQVNRNSHPLSVAVQTDDAELYRIGECSWLAAERELSPRAAAPSSGQICDKQGTSTIDRRRSYGDYDEHTSSVKKSARDKLTSDLRHTYMPSIFDADAIEMRNLQAQKEAAERRQFYQQELKNQIMEQQRIREERKTREKMLEQAEMRRLEEQLRMLKMAQEKEIIRHGDIESAMKNNERDYDTRRAHLQTEIDIEQDKLLRSKSQPLTHTNKRPIITSKSDNQRSKLPFFYPHADKTFKPIEVERDRKPYSFNISDNSVFSKNYDVDTYLRKNLNFKEKNFDSGDAVKVYKDLDNESQRIVEKALVHEPKERFYGKTKSKDFMDRVERQIEADSRRIDSENRRIESENKRIEAENRRIDSDNRRLDSENRRIDADRKLESESRLLESEKLISTVDMTDIRSRTEKRKSDSERIDERISIPLLRHSPSKQQESIEEPNDMSDAMKTIDNKWKVPAVQKNILKSMPNDEGKNISILTQLGSIRRQLQLEQLKLDKMHTVKT